MEILTLTVFYHYWVFNLWLYATTYLHQLSVNIFRSNNIINFINIDYPFTAKAWKNQIMMTVSNSIISLISLSKIIYPEPWIYIFYFIIFLDLYFLNWRECVGKSLTRERQGGSSKLVSLLSSLSKYLDPWESFSLYKAIEFCDAYKLFQYFRSVSRTTTWRSSLIHS